MTASWPRVRLIGVTTPIEDPDWLDAGQPPLGLPGPLGLIEYAGRWDYGPASVAKMKGTPEEIIGRWLATGEESMVEMVDATFLVTCSRVVSHELVRHRLASYQQESQRFVNYGEEDPEALFYIPYEDLPESGESLGRFFKDKLLAAFEAYADLRGAGVSKQLARYVLPNATRTRIVVKANLREWRHILRLRMHTSAQPEMREVMTIVHSKLQRTFGAVLFPDNIADERSAR